MVKRLKAYGIIASFRLEKTFKIRESVSHKVLKRSLHTQIQSSKYVVTKDKCINML